MALNYKEFQSSSKTLQAEAIKGLTLSEMKEKAGIKSRIERNASMQEEHEKFDKKRKERREDRFENNNLEIRNLIINIIKSMLPEALWERNTTTTDDSALTLHDNGVIDWSEGGGGTVTDIRYDATTKQLQKKTVAVPDWTIIEGGQAEECP